MRYGDYSFCAYSSKGTLEAFSDLAIQVTVNHQHFLLELYFDSIETGDIHKSLSFFVKEKDGFSKHSYRYYDENNAPFRESFPNIQDVVLAFAEQLPDANHQYTINFTKRRATHVVFSRSCKKAWYTVNRTI